MQVNRAFIILGIVLTQIIVSVLISTYLITQYSDQQNKIKASAANENKTASFTNDDIAIVYLIENQYRKQHGLAMLTVNPELEAVAHAKAMDMYSHGVYDHNYNGIKFSDFFTAAGYSYKHAGENIALDNYNPFTVMKAWEISPEHNKNLLDPNYTEIGISATCPTKSVCYVVMDLGSR